jgi:hypothetical protein
MARRVRQVSPWWCAVVLGLAGACGDSSPDRPDPYYGVVDATVFDSKFLPSTDRMHCPNGACYSPQSGFQGGSPISFYNFGAIKPSALPSDMTGPHIPTSLAVRGYSFDRCIPGGFDQFADAFDRRVQYPILNALPLASSNSRALILPLYAVYDVTGVSDNVCDDLKIAGSITIPPAPPGRFGATSSTTPMYRLWAPIDMTAKLTPLAMGSTFTSEGAWYGGLQLRLLDGGPIPLDASGHNLAWMEGVIVHPSTQVQSKPTDPKVVILPLKPGDPGYSPIVRLHDFILPMGKSIGDFTGICTQPPCTDPAQVDISMATNASNVIFVVWSLVQ